ncbi:uncharacterized protein LOC135168982 isoform X2 [Diachasmimorpha longicaudata]|uniref:uncharacterized protein LOC135168982 isoform X2 n=1 Tax=Diachasmimorpha longicaudata TaxID=58733 RepID=UPI0030B9077B
MQALEIPEVATQMETQMDSKLLRKTAERTADNIEREDDEDELEMSCSALRMRDRPISGCGVFSHHSCVLRRIVTICEDTIIIIHFPLH